MWCMHSKNFRMRFEFDLEGPKTDYLNAYFEKQAELRIEVAL